MWLHNKFTKPLIVSVSLLVSGLLIPTLALAEAPNPWSDMAFRSIGDQDSGNSNVLALRGRRMAVDLSQIQASLVGDNSLRLSVPLPDGSHAVYIFSATPTMAPGLAARYPMIRTFTAHEEGNPVNRGRFDITPQGFHGMFSHNGRWVLIDPDTRGDALRYLVYYRDDAQPLYDLPVDKVLPNNDSTPSMVTAATAARPVTSNQIRMFRLAVSATGEYTRFHGGTKAGGLSAITTMVNRVNEIYQRDLSIRFQLVSGNDDLIFTNPLNDPFDNTDSDINRNRNVINSRIGSTNYDIGHVVGTGLGGLALWRAVCSANKAQGVTGTPNPTGDAFYIDFVAHELGHQMGGSHTYNGRVASCGQGRSEDTAWEPGSGSTIMGYAGICGSQSLQRNSDPFFHIGSIEEILDHVSNVSCGVTSTLSNTIPTANAGTDFTIPANTPFMLTGSGSDADGDAITYSWEQLDTGAASGGTAEMVDNGNRPLFRSFAPTTSATRYLPKLADVAGGLMPGSGETYPTQNRSLNFRLTVRDGKGGVATDDLVVTINTSLQNISIVSPTASSQWAVGSSQIIRWNVAGTNAAPLNCSQVNIALSTDGGISYGINIAQNTANDGSHSWTVPGNINTSNARIMVQCPNNGMLAISAGNFQLGRGASAIMSGNSSSGGGSVVWWLLIGLLGLLIGSRARARILNLDFH